MILTYSDLKRAAGGNNPAQVVANLQYMGIKFTLRPDGKPISTIDAINAAMKLKSKQSTGTDSQQDIEV